MKPQELGRNDPCWCGSGKKYKKCHLAEDEKREAEQHRPMPARTEYFDAIQGRWRQFGFGVGSTSRLGRSPE